MEGKKYDGNKIPLDVPLQQFPHSLEAIAIVAKYGHDKYELSDDDWGNWCKVENAVFRYKQAAMRHKIQHDKGEVLDLESGLPHMFHYMWNVLAYNELIIREQMIKKE